MPTISLIPPDPAHAPAGDSHRAILYPLWVLRLEIRLFPGGEPRVLHFSVDAVRSVPLPIKGIPEIVEQEIPENMRILEGVDLPQAQAVTRHFTKKGIGRPASFLSRIQFREAKKIYKLFWIVGDDAEGETLIDSRSGKRIPMPRDLAGELPASG